MNQLLTGAGSVTLTPPKYEQIFIRSVDITGPTTGSASLTISGSVSGVYNIYSEMENLEKAFLTDETVTLTMSGSGLISVAYDYKGSAVNNWQFIDLNRKELLLPNRLLHPITPVNASGDLH